MPYEVKILPTSGIYASAVNGVPVPGPAIGATGVRYVPEGSMLDNIPTFSFRIPLSVYRNNAIRTNTRIDLMDVDIAKTVARGYVLTRQVTANKDGEWAQISCVDLSDELRRDTVTTGFATGPNESFMTTGQRLVGLSSKSWSFASTLGTAFDGVTFTANGSIGAAAGKYAQERFAHWRRDAAPDSATATFTRVLNLDIFGQPSGFTLGQAAPNPTQARQVNDALRQIQDGGFSFTEDGNVVNCLVPTGGGNGIGQVTLYYLYNATGETLIDAARQIYRSGPVSFNGFNSLYPLYKRPRQDGGAGAISGYEFFIRDDASIATNGEWWDGWSNTQIAPITSGGGVVAPADMANAAGSLYVAALAHLKWNSQPKTEYRITTEGHGDLRNLGGTTVRVQYRGFAWERGNPKTVISLDIDTDLTVMSVEVSESDDGASQTAVWTVATNGQYATTTASILVGKISQLEAGALVAQTGLGFPNLPFLGILDKSAPMTRYLPGNGGIVQLLQARIAVYVIPAWSPVQPKVHGHASPLPAIPHDVGNAGANVTHDANALELHFAIGNTATYTDGSVDYDPNPSLQITSGAPPASAKRLMSDGSRVWFEGGGDGKLIDILANTLRITSTTPTANGTGGTVKSTDDGTQPGKGGKTVKQDKFTTSTKDVDTVTDAVGMEWGRYENPAPLPPVAVAVGGTVVGTTNSVGSFDCTAAVAAAGLGRTDVAVTFTTAGVSGNTSGLCYVYGILWLRTVCTNLNATI